MKDQDNDIFKSIQTESKGSFKDRGSKFLAFAFPVSTDDEVKSHLQLLKKEFHDARHHCYAYRLGMENQQYRLNDDGEPSGTAGKPIYGQILSFELTNILIVVVRYFGGTLLGTSGLIRAYREAAKDCILNAVTIEISEQVKLSIQFRYEEMNTVMRIIKEEMAIILEQHFESACSLSMNIRKSHYNKLFDRLNRIDHVLICKN
jgi:uncharacterized YigZ family protein